jgi:hypothetical protein
VANPRRILKRETNFKEIPQFYAGLLCVSKIAYAIAEYGRFFKKCGGKWQLYYIIKEK